MCVVIAISNNKEIDNGSHITSNCILSNIYNKKKKTQIELYVCWISAPTANNNNNSRMGNTNNKIKFKFSN